MHAPSHQLSSCHSPLPPCMQLTVTNKSEAGANSVVFTCGQWFAKDVGDGQIVRTLKLGKSSAAPSRKYKVGSGCARLVTHGAHVCVGANLALPSM